MANPEHVAKLREGWAAWNAWRQENHETPDLSGIELVGNSLNHYKLSGTNFSAARLHRVTVTSGFMDACSFDGANIVEATFRATTLDKSTFRKAAIAFSLFDWCRLDESDFTDATLVLNTFGAASLKNVRGLDSLKNSRVNSVGIDTFFNSGGLPANFLRAAAAPEEFITYAASLVGTAIEYYSCFLSYSSKDEVFARRLYADLQAKNIRTWFAPEDLKIGDRFRPRIDEAIRFHDKLVLVLSTSSVASDWVETEVESALEREQHEGKDVLFPIAIDDDGFGSQQAWARDIRRKRHIGDFRHDYAAAFDRLVRDLKKSTPPIIMKGG